MTEPSILLPNKEAGANLGGPPSLGCGWVADVAVSCQRESVLGETKSTIASGDAALER